MKASVGQLRAALAKPDPNVRLFLLHGPDTAGAADLASQLAKAMGPDAERIDLEAATLKTDPARLADEAASLSLFGGARFIRVTGAGEEAVDAVAALLDAERAGNPAVVIAPGVKTSGKLVKLALAHPHAMAYACYLPEGQNAERMIQQIAAEHGLRPAPGVARRIAEASGNDRAVATREIEKLALYLDAAPDRPHDLDAATLDAVGADLADSDSTPAIEALLAGDPMALGAEIAALDGANVSPVTWLRAAQRRLLQLADMRAAIDAGEPADRVMKAQRVHFTQEAATTAALGRWTAPMLTTALDRVRTAERATMAPANPGPVVAAAAALTLARKVARRG